MIQLTTTDARTVLVAPTSIASIEEARPSVRGTGARSVVTLTDGRTIESRETVDAISKASAQRGPAAPIGAGSDYRTR